MPWTEVDLSYTDICTSPMLQNEEISEPFYRDATPEICDKTVDIDRPLIIRTKAYDNSREIYPRARKAILTQARNNTQEASTVRTSMRTWHVEQAREHSHAPAEP